MGARLWVRLRVHEVFAMVAFLLAAVHTGVPDDQYTIKAWTLWVDSFDSVLIIRGGCSVWCCWIESQSAQTLDA